MVGFATLPDHARTEAGSLQTLLRNIGASVGVSATVALLARSAQVNQSYLAEHFTPYDVARWTAVGSPPGANVATAGLLGEIGRQATAIGYANDFYLLAAVTVATLPLLLLLRSRGAAISKPALVADAGH